TDIERSVRMGDPISVVPNAGPFNMIETTSKLELNNDLRQFLIGDVGVSEGCSEFLVLNGQLENERQGDTLARVYFSFDRSQLTDASLYILDKIVKLASLSSSKFLLDGHTDSVGSPDYNLALGEQRAKSVAFYLQSKGVEGVSTLSSGEFTPVDTNSTTQGRANNRRVEVMVN
ncbi:OmpA family protein, partial [Vibrio makurazakiensis]|uniref:OmpA family protein n=1 Tax=Vibrio makurazakiensis TaxID=2910250 RepID=UPI003D0A3CDF